MELWSVQGLAHLECKAYSINSALSMLSLVMYAYVCG